MFTRRGAALVLAASAAFLAACQNAAPGASAGDMALGPENAKVTLVEYASTTCGHCATFHATVFPEIKKAYIDTGKIRYVFREYPTQPAELAAAGFQFARCGGATPEIYFQRLDTFFSQQEAIFQAYGQGAVRAKLDQLAAEAGLAPATFDACLRDPAAAKRITEIAEAARSLNISGTPTLLLNGVVLPNTVETPYSVERLRKEIDAKLAG